MRAYTPLLRLIFLCALILAALTGYAQQTPPLGVSKQPWQTALYSPNNVATLTVYMKTPAGATAYFTDSSNVTWTNVSVTLPANTAYGLGYLLTQTKPDGTHFLKALTNTPNYLYIVTNVPLATAPSGTYDSSVGGGNGIISKPTNQIILNGTTTTSLTPGNTYQIGPDTTITQSVTTLQTSGVGNLQSQTTAVGQVALQSPIATGTFEVQAYLLLTAVATDVIQITVAYTDQNGTARTASMIVQGTTSPSMSATGAYTFTPMLIRAKANTNITVSTQLTTSSGSITYDVGAQITHFN